MVVKNGLTSRTVFEKPSKSFMSPAKRHGEISNNSDKRQEGGHYQSCHNAACRSQRIIFRKIKRASVEGFHFLFLVALHPVGFIGDFFVHIGSWWVGLNFMPAKQFQGIYQFWLKFDRHGVRQGCL